MTNHKAHRVGSDCVTGVVAAARFGADAMVGVPREVVGQSRDLLREFDLRDTDVTPTAVPLLALEALAERAVLAAFQFSLIDHPPEIVERIAREVVELEEYLGRNGWLDDPVGYHREPPPLTAPGVRHDRVGGLDIERLDFASGYLPDVGEPGRERWARYEHNERAHAWVLRHAEAEHRAIERPWLILHHGASMGWALADLAIFRAAWLHHDLGLNLVFPVLPFHGPRQARHPLGIQLPVEDPVDTVHTFAQSVWDTRRIIGWIRDRSDAPIAVHGLSLGAYTASLIASVVDELAGVIVGVPAASLSDLYAEHMPARLRHRPQFERFVESSRTALSVVSPLSVEPLVPVERRYLYAATSDRITESKSQAGRLRTHWGEPETLWLPGGHLSVAWSSDVTDFVQSALAECGMVDSDR